MKLKEIKPNAHYDLIHGKPSVFEKDNDGSFLYRFNIEPESGILDDAAEETQIGWQCYELRIWGRPTKGILKKAVIRSVLDESAEFALVNAYNKHLLGIKEDESAVEKYREFLGFTEELDALLINDFANNEVS